MIKIRHEFNDYSMKAGMSIMMDEEKAREYSSFICEMHYRIFCDNNKMWKKIELKTGITSSQARVLLNLENKNGCTISELAQLCLLHISTIFKMLKIMNKNKLVTISTDENDHRVKTVHITAYGKKKLRQFMTCYWETSLLKENIKSLSNEELDRLFGGLRIFVELKLGKEEAEQLFKNLH